MRITQVVNLRSDNRRRKISDDTARAIFTYLKTHSYDQAAKYFEVHKSTLYGLKPRFVKLGLMADNEESIMEQIKKLQPQTRSEHPEIDRAIAALKLRVQELRERANSIERVIEELPTLVIA